MVKDPIIYSNIVQKYNARLKPCPFCGEKAQIHICGECNDLMYVRCVSVVCQAAPFGATAIYHNPKN